MRRAGTFAVAVAALLTVVAAPAAAVKQATEEPKLGQVIERDYPLIPGQYAGAGAAGVTPDPHDCETAFAAVCDVIPFHIVPPDLPDTDDWTVSFDISWHDPEELNDIDIYLFDNKQTAGDGTYTIVDDAASAANPEKIAIFEPDLVDYNLVIINFSGVNAGYHLRAEMVNNEFTGAFELLAPSFKFSSGDDDDVVVEDLSGIEDEDAPAPFDFSAVPEDVPGAPIAPSFGEVAAVADPAFEQFPTTDFSEEIKAPHVPRAGATDLPPLQDVSAAVAGFWLGAVPLALLGAGAVFLLRRARTSFALAGL